MLVDEGEAGSERSDDELDPPPAPLHASDIGLASLHPWGDMLQVVAEVAQAFNGRTTPAPRSWASTTTRTTYADRGRDPTAGRSARPSAAHAVGAHVGQVVEWAQGLYADAEAQQLGGTAAGPAGEPRPMSLPGGLPRAPRAPTPAWACEAGAVLALGVWGGVGLMCACTPQAKRYFDGIGVHWYARWLKVLCRG